MRRFLAAVGAVGAAGLAVPTGTAATPAPVPPASLAPAVGPLVAQLGADAFADREAAAKALLSLGEAALPALDRAAADAPDREARDRAARLADQLRRTAEAARTLAAAPISFDYVGVPLSTAVADLKARTNVPLTLDIPGVADPLRRVTVKADALPPWQAIEEFCRAAGLREVFRPEAGPDLVNPGNVDQLGRRRIAYSMAEVPQPLAGLVPVILADGKPDALPGDRSSAVRVIALPAAFPGNRVLRGSGEIVLNLDVTPLPGVRWTDVAAVRVSRAEDETGRPLSLSFRPDPVPGVNGEYAQFQAFGGFAGQAVWIEDGSGRPRTGGRPNPRVVPVKLRTDDRLVTRLRVFEGVVVGEVSVPNQVLVTVPDLAKAAGGTEYGPGETKLSVLGYEVKADGRTVMKVRSEGPNPWTLARLGVRNRAWANPGADGAATVMNIGAMKFFDAAGKPTRTPSVMSSSMHDDGVRQTQELELHFPKQADAGPPARLDVVGNKAITVDVPFRMENVRLP